MTGEKTHQYTASDHATYTTNLIFFSSGTQSCTVTDNANVPVSTTASLQIMPGAIADFGLAFTNTPLTAGDTNNPLTITAKDTWGNIVDGYNAMIDITVDNNPNTLFSIQMANSQASTSNVVFTLAGEHVVTVYDANQTTTESLSVSVVAGQVTRLVWDLVQNSNVLTYQKFSTTVALYDNYNNKATNYAGDLNWSSTDPQAQFFESGQASSLSGNSYSMNSSTDLGEKQFDVQLKTLTDHVVSQLQNITIKTSVNPNAVLTGTLKIFPSSNYYVVSKATDNGNNYFIAGKKTTVYVSGYTQTGDDLPSDMHTSNVLSSPDASDANVISSLVDQNSNVFLIYDAVTFYTASDRSSLVIADTNQTHLSGAISLPVRAASIANIVLTGLSSGTSGYAQTARVRAVDAYSNLITGYLGTVHFTSNDATAVLPADYTFTTQDAGQHDFVSGVTLNGNGIFNVSVTDTTNNYTAQANQLLIQP